MTQQKVHFNVFKFINAFFYGNDYCHLLKRCFPIPRSECFAWIFSFKMFVYYFSFTKCLCVIPKNIDILLRTHNIVFRWKKLTLIQYFLINWIYLCSINVFDFFETSLFILGVADSQAFGKNNTKILYILYLLSFCGSIL